MSASLSASAHGDKVSPALHMSVIYVPHSSVIERPKCLDIIKQLTVWASAAPRGEYAIHATQTFTQRNVFYTLLGVTHWCCHWSIRRSIWNSILGHFWDQLRATSFTSCDVSTYPDICVVLLVIYSTAVCAH